MVPVRAAASAFPAEFRKVFYPTNAIESLHMQLRKMLKNRGHFPNDEAAAKLIYLALQDSTRHSRAQRGTTWPALAAGTRASGPAKPTGCLAHVAPRLAEWESIYWKFH